MPAATASSYSITMRLHTLPDHGVVGSVATAISGAGGIVTAIDVTESSNTRLVLDVTCSAADADHATLLTAAVDAVDGVEVYKVSDRTFLLHIGGKIEVESKVPLKNRDDLSMAYTPGVGRVSMAIHDNPDDVWRLTVKGNSVAVVTDGSAVLGLGNIGPGAAMPVMEGKAALFKRFAGIDAWPICLASQDVDEIVRAVEMIAPGFGGINLEDIAAPRCFEIERRLRASLDIPVFHDDQHGTAIVVLAALTNALRVVSKELAAVRVVVSGGGAAGTAIVTLLLAAGMTDVVVVDREGAICAGDDALSPAHRDLAEATNPRRVTGDLHTVLTGADVFIGVSAPRILEPAWIDDMADGAVVFALANPDPEVDPAEAGKHAAVVASGRSDYPNQINNVLAFPGVFRGLLDARAEDVTIDMMLRAAAAIAATVGDEELNPSFIIPSVFNPEVPKAVAAAISGRGPGTIGAWRGARAQPGSSTTWSSRGCAGPWGTPSPARPSGSRRGAATRTGGCSWPPAGPTPARCTPWPPSCAPRARWCGAASPPSPPRWTPSARC
jgi:malate dehydrogenase (oxaloacetate-decarboxylating)